MSRILLLVKKQYGDRLLPDEIITTRPQQDETYQPSQHSLDVIMNFASNYKANCNILPRI